MPIRVIAVEFVYSVKTKLRLNSPEMYSSSFDKIDVIIVCYENIYTIATALFTSNKMPLFLLCNNEHFHPYFAIIFFKMKSASFSVVYTKQIWQPFLALAIFFLFIPWEKPRYRKPWQVSLLRRDSRYVKRPLRRRKGEYRE